MPPKKRTNHSKTSSPTTSTSQAHADHNPLRGQTGSIVGTRARSSSKPQPAPERTPASHPKDVVIEEEQGKKSEKKSKSKPVATPRICGGTTFARFVYVLASIAVVLLVWYAYGMVMLLERLKDEVGWWGVVVGGDPSMARLSPWLTAKGWGFGSGAGRSEGGDLEESLNALAEALGVDPVEVALAVRPLVPRASMTSMASKAGRTGGSEAVRVLFEEGGGSNGARTIVQEFADDTTEGEVLD